MPIWEQVLVGVLGLGLLLLFWPGVRETLKRSREAEKDWPALIKPLVVVVLFVMLLIAMA